MITITVNNKESFITNCSTHRRSTCDECKRRRLCSTTWVHTKIRYCGRVSSQALDMGDLCKECREKLQEVPWNENH